MHYKNEALRQLTQLLKDNPDYSFGEVLYSMLRLTSSEKISDLKNLSDEDIYTAIEKASDLEKE